MYPIGAGPFLTMAIDATKGFTQADFKANYTACVISGDNEVGMGEAGSKLFGKIVWVSDDLIPGTGRPATCAVQARGVASFKYAAPTRWLKWTAREKFVSHPEAIRCTAG